MYHLWMNERKSRNSYLVLNSKTYLKYILKLLYHIYSHGKEKIKIKALVVRDKR